MSFILQDQALLFPCVCKDIREDEVGTRRRLPGLDNVVQGTWRRARDELMAHVKEDGARWAAVNTVVARTVPAPPLKKKLKAGTWVETKPVPKVEKTFSPTGGTSAGAQGAMLVVAIHVACAQALHPGKKSICDAALCRDRGDLQVAQHKDEPDDDLDVAEHLFQAATEEGAPQHPLERGDWRPAKAPLHRHIPLRAAPGRKRPSQRPADEISHKYVNLAGSAHAHVRKRLGVPS